MPSSRLGPHRHPSRLIALAIVALALAAPIAHAEADYEWAGGAHTRWSEKNWYEVGSNDLTKVDLGYSTYLNFGRSNGGNTALNDDLGTGGVRYLGFSYQNWQLSGSQLNFDQNGSLNVLTAQGAGINVKIANDIHLLTDIGYTQTSLPVLVDAGSTLTLTGHLDNDGGLDKTGEGTLTLGGFHNYTGNTVVDAGRVIDFFPQGNYVVNANLEFQSDASQTFGGSISGGGTFTKSGGGELNLTGSLGYTGATFVNAGTLILQVPKTSSATIASGAFFETRMNQTATYAGTISGAGSFIKSGTGTLTRSGASDFTGLTEVRAGALIDLHPHGDYNNLATLTFNVADNQTYAGAIYGTGTLNKTGAGTLTHTGVDYSSGTTNVQGGRLIDAYPAFGDYYVYGGATLEIRTATRDGYDGRIDGAGSFTMGGAGTLTLVGSNTYSGGTTVNAGRLIDQNPHGDYATNADLEFANAANRDFTTPVVVGPATPNVVSGTGNLTKSGAGTLTLFAPSTYAGSTTIAGGAIVGLVTNALPTSTALTVGASGTFIAVGNQTLASLSGAGSVGVNGALTVNGPASTTFSGVIGGGSLTQAGTGTLTLSGKNTYSGGTTVSRGDLIDANPHGAYVDNAVLEFATATDQSFSGVVSGTGFLVKGGTGTLTLSGQNAHTGGTAIAGGTLREAVDYALPAGRDLDVEPGATLDVNGHVQSLGKLTGGGGIGLGGSSGALYLNDASDSTFDGTISGAGTLYKGNAGTLTLTGANAYTGGTTVGNGTLIDQNPHGTYVTNANLEFQNAGDLTHSPAITGTGAFVKDGAGTLTLSGANTYAGGTTILAGTLVDLNPHGKYNNKAILEFAPAADLSYAGGDIGGFGTFVKAGAGTLTLTSAISSGIAVQLESGTLKGSGSVFRNVWSTGGTLQLDDASPATYGGAYSGAGALLKTGNGALTMQVVPANTGGVRVSGGTLAVRAAGTMGGGLTVDSGATFLSRSGGTLAVGGRTLVQGAVDTASGSTTDFTGLVSGAGNFVDTGTVRFDGGYSPGNGPASVAFGGALALGSANLLTMELGGTALGAGYDHLNVLGTATLGGTLNVVTTNGFSATLGQSFDLFDFSSSNGTFSLVTLPTLGDGLAWNTSALYTTGTIRVAQATPEPSALAALSLGAVGLLRRRKRA